MEHCMGLGEVYCIVKKFVLLGRKMSEIYNDKHCAQNGRFSGNILGACDTEALVPMA